MCQTPPPAGVMYASQSFAPAVVLDRDRGRPSAGHVLVRDVEERVQELPTTGRAPCSGRSAPTRRRCRRSGTSRPRTRRVHPPSRPPRSWCPDRRARRTRRRPRPRALPRTCRRWAAAPGGAWPGASRARAGLRRASTLAALARAVEPETPPMIAASGDQDERNEADKAQAQSLPGHTSPLVRLP